MSTTSPISPSGPLNGLNVLNLSQRYAYYCGKLFADMGADVILIEPPGVGSVLRTQPPFLEDREHPEYGIPFFYFNTSKRGITIDMKHPKSLGVIRKLIAQSDIVANNFAAGVMGIELHRAADERAAALPIASVGNKEAQEASRESIHGV